jgi:hypothetical protein
MNITKRILACSLVAGIISTATPTPAVCIWSTLPGGGGNCSDASCGVGCTIVGIGVTTTECYSGGFPSPGCCICSWAITTCDCWFGSGTGRESSTNYYSGAICVASGTPPYSYACYVPGSPKPLPSPSPVGTTPGAE